MGIAERKLREKQARRETILSSAREVFSQKDFLTATIEDIAKDCELSVGTLYLYFKSKEDMYVSLLFESLDFFTREILKIKQKNVSPDKKIKKIWEFFYQFYREHPDYYKIISFLNQKSVVSAVSRETLQELNQRSGKNFSLVADIVKECMDAGIYKNHAPRKVVDMLWGFFTGIVQLTEVRQNLSLDIETLENLHLTCFHCLEDGLRKKVRY